MLHVKQGHNFKKNKSWHPIVEHDGFPFSRVWMVFDVYLYVLDGDGDDW